MLPQIQLNGSSGAADADVSFPATSSFLGMLLDMLSVFLSSRKFGQLICNSCAADRDGAFPATSSLLGMLLEMLPIFLRHASATGELRLALGAHALAHLHQADDHPELMRVCCSTPPPHIERKVSRVSFGGKTLGRKVADFTGR
jgi:hypothetical protein